MRVRNYRARLFRLRHLSDNPRTVTRPMVGRMNMDAPWVFLL